MLQQKLETGEGMVWRYARLMRVHRPVGYALLLWPTWSALWLASGGWPNRYWLWIFTAGVLISRSQGCVINDWADRKIDGQVARTRTRELATGKISAHAAIRLFILLSLGSLGLAACLPLHAWKVIPIAAGLMVAYPFFKRFSYMPQAILGLAFSMGIPMVFLSIQDRLPLEGVVLMCANWCWTVAYDTAYAIIDREDDLKIGVKSTAIWVGDWDRWMIHGGTGLAMSGYAALFWIVPLSSCYWIGYFAALACLLHQIVRFDIRQPKEAFDLFRHHTWMGFWWWVAIVLGTSVK